VRLFVWGTSGRSMFFVVVNIFFLQWEWKLDPSEGYSIKWVYHLLTQAVHGEPIVLTLRDLI
jgi:hypothetical protein